MTSFVLVPGPFHSLGHFASLEALLQCGDSNDVLLLDLHALPVDESDPPRSVFELHVAATLHAIDSAKKPVVLCGHSLAGCVITAAAQQRHASLQKIVYIAGESLPGELSYKLEPQSICIAESLFSLDSQGRMVIVNGQEKRMGMLFYSGATEAERECAVKLVRPSYIYTEDAWKHLVLDQFWSVPKAYIKCIHDQVMLPVHQDTMHLRLREGALKFELDCGHCPFVTCPEKLAVLLQQIAAMPALQFQPLRHLCEIAWQDSVKPGVQIDIISKRLVDHTTESASSSGAPAEIRPAKRLHPPEQVGASHDVAYRISKSRRDSTLVKVMRFPNGVMPGARVLYWYDSFVDDPKQYTNCSLNVPERGHEESLDIAGISRSLCAEGVVVSIKGHRISFVWEKIVTKLPGSAWVEDRDTAEVWGVDGRMWNGSYANSDGSFAEHLASYAKGSAEAFWEDIPKKATSLLATIEGRCRARAS